MRIGGRRLVTAAAAVILAGTLGLAGAVAQSIVEVMPGWSVEFNSGKPAVTRVRLTAGASATRLEFDLTKRVAPKVSVVSDPHRVIIDLPKVEFRIDSAAGQSGKGLVRAFRFGLFRAEQSRIVIDTEGQVYVLKARVEGNGQLQLVVELSRDDPGAPLPAASAPAASLPNVSIPPPALRPSRFADPPPPATSHGGRPVIVIDAGHGGLDPGAVAPGGVLEKDVVLSVARRLKTVLADTGRYTVVMTRNRDIYVSLAQRVRISRRHNADLFISLHADAVAEQDMAHLVRGGTVYTLSEYASDEQARRLAEKENAVDVLAGLTSASRDEQDEVRNILIDLLRRETESFAADFSNLLINELRKHITLARDPQRSAAFQVLKQAESPSVLVELGYMSNEEDRKLLAAPQWQDDVARAIAAAVDSFFARRNMGVVRAP